jgi:hypothetical protein
VTDERSDRVVIPLNGESGSNGFIGPRGGSDSHTPQPSGAEIRAMTRAQVEDYKARRADREYRARQALGLEPGAPRILPPSTGSRGRFARDGSSVPLAAARRRLLCGVLVGLPLAAGCSWVIWTYPYFAAACILAAAVALSVTAVIREAAGDGRTDQ